ncbi:hypothetical protein B296_00058014 [Ensete ventricosum]|uniref:Uncharacterized protein n=1 Tax=Ensete ventricosum TaxID=4639 RepID=A0A426WYM2_ENSVE|nr:hypothetical protein B296_00058014 [Ensete ventricosum]
MQRGSQLRQGPLQRGDRLRPGLARPRPDRRGNRPRVDGFSTAPAWGGSRPRPCRKGCCQPSTNSRPQEGNLRAEAPPTRSAACKGGR